MRGNSKASRALNEMKIIQSKTEPTMLWFLIGKEEFKFIKLQEAFIPMRVAVSDSELLTSPKEVLKQKSKALIKMISNTTSKAPGWGREGYVCRGTPTAPQL